MEPNHPDTPRTPAETLRAIPAKVGAAAGTVAGAAVAAGKEVGQVAREETADLRQDLDELIRQVPTMSAEAIATAKEQFLQKAELARRHARHLRDDMRAQFNQCVDATTEHVREQPLRSLAAGIGLGLLIGLIIAPRHDR
jgi:ElaB/YqjD/DUF883 family membrane-anchored ribosome-binding protein